AEPRLELQQPRRFRDVMRGERAARAIGLRGLKTAVNRLRRPEEHIALVQGRRAEFESVPANHVQDEFLVTVVMERDVEIAAVFGHVDPMDRRTDYAETGDRC